MFSDMLGHQRVWQGHAHFWRTFRFWVFFSKLCFHRVAYDLERQFQNFLGIFGQPVGRGKATLIYSQKLKLDIF